jgi:hypothetical protein
MSLQKEIMHCNNFKAMPLAESNIINYGIRINSKFNFKCDTTAYKLPFMYLIPKFHKNPVKFRPITSSVSTVFKPINIFLNSFLDQLYGFIRSSTNVLYKNNLIINNSSQVMECIEDIEAYTIHSYDFTSLYTKIPLQLLQEVIFELVDEYWPPNRLFSYNYNRFIISEIKDILVLGLKHNYVKYKNSIFQQTVGIPMGANYSVHLANLFLFYYEHEFINNLTIKDTYKFTFRYIDDLLAINNCNISNDIYHIYPSCMTVENSNFFPFQEANYLDLKISVINDKYSIELFDKRRLFNFKIYSFPHVSSNIPIYMVYNTFSAQIGRITKICFNNICNFTLNIRILFEKFMENGYQRRELIKLFLVFKKKHLYASSFLELFVNSKEGSSLLTP